MLDVSGTSFFANALTIGHLYLRIWSRVLRWRRDCLLLLSPFLRIDLLREVLASYPDARLMRSLDLLQATDACLWPCAFGFILSLLELFPL